MTKQECAIVMAYTGICTLAEDDLTYFYKYVEKLMGRPVQTIEYLLLSDTISELAKGDFYNICRQATESVEDGRNGQ